MGLFAASPLRPWVIREDEKVRNARKPTEPVLGTLFAAALLSPTVAAGADGPTLARDGKSEYVIVVPAKATPVETTAAHELREHLARVTGAAWPVVAEGAAPAGAPRVVVGHGALARKLLPNLDVGRLAPDAIVLKTVGRDLVLVGHPRRGTLYAVYTFLEDVVGVRWWAMDEATIPQRPTLVVPRLDVAYAPKVQDRATRYLQLSDGCFTSHGLVTKQEQRQMGVLSARLRLNGHDHYSIPAEYGGPNGLVGWVHTFYQINGLLPPKRYFKEHPEWYSLVKGKRVDRHGQLCLTNEAMRREMVRVVLERLRQNPNATIISVSQNDWRGNCECESCRAVDAREGSPSGSLIHFINAIAEDVEKEFPHVLVETLAYHYTRHAPRFVRPRRNVVVRLCSIECSFAEPLTEGEQNKAFRDDIEDWSRVAHQLYIWDYVTNFRGYLLPHPNYHVLAPNIRTFVDKGAIGIFEQGDSGCRVGDFVRYRAWLTAHLLWNPGADEKQLTQEFMTGYYGAAGPHLIQYLELMSDAVRRSGIRLGCFRTTTADWLKLDDMNRAMELFAHAAAAVADNPVLSKRVRRERLPLDHVWLRRYGSLRRQAKRTGAPFLGPDDPDNALEEFLALVKQHRVGEIRQGRAFPKDFGQDLPFRARRRIPPGKTPELCKGLAKQDWIDLQEADYIPRQRRGLFTIEKDAAASNGLARRMPNTHTIWACHSYPLGDFGVTDGSRWHVYMQVRCDAKSEQGIAMRVGIYDDARHRSVKTLALAANDIRGARYRRIDLGTHTLSGSMYVWAAPVVRAPEEVEAVYVDRVFLIADK